MRPAAAFAALAAAALALPPVPAGGLVAAPPAGQAPSAPLARQTPTAQPGGTAVCTVRSPLATELSGLVVTATGYVSINDSRDDPRQIRIFYLDARCALTKSVHYPTAARDPEDLAEAPDGTLWVADTGDNPTATEHRATVALWHLPVDGSAPVIYRLRYPDGPHDAEALFFTPAGTPVIVTKEISGRSGIYEPTGALQPHTTSGVAMRRVGEFSPTVTGVANPLAKIGEVLVTGAATTPDRRRVALRTYAAAYEWDVPDGDPVAAITNTAPRVTPLPNEPQGEAIAYSPDGTTFLTLSDEPGPTTLRRYPVATATTVATTAAAAGPPPAPAVPPALPPWAIAGAAVGGLTLAAAGLLGLRRARR